MARPGSWGRGVGLHIGQVPDKSLFPAGKPMIQLGAYHHMLGSSTIGDDDRVPESRLVRAPGMALQIVND